MGFTSEKIPTTKLVSVSVHKATMFLFQLIALSYLGVALAEVHVSSYKCSFCISTVDKMNKMDVDFMTACESQFGAGDECNLFRSTADSIKGTDARGACVSAGICPMEEEWQQFSSEEAVHDLRISKAFAGSNGYNKVIPCKFHSFILIFVTFLFIDSCYRCFEPHH